LEVEIDNEIEKLHRVAGVLDRSSAKKKRDNILSYGMNHPQFENVQKITRNINNDL